MSYIIYVQTEKTGSMPVTSSGDTPETIVGAADSAQCQDFLRPRVPTISCRCRALPEDISSASS